MTVKYNYHQGLDEFVECPDETVSDKITGNSVTVRREGGELRYDIRVDDFGYVLGAMNRLIRRLVPGFRFPG